MITVYIASPYTLGDLAYNVRRQIEMADKLMGIDVCPIVPLFTHFQHMFYPRHYDEWMKIDIEKISRCDVVLRLQGASKGADKEVKHAKKLNIPVCYDFNELVDKINNKEIFERTFNK